MPKEQPQLRFVSERVPGGQPLAKRLGVPSAQVLTRGPDQVVVDHVWLDVPIDADWLATSRLVVQEGQLVVGELRVIPRERENPVPGRWSAEVVGVRAQVPPGGLSARTVRRVHLSDHLAHGQEVLAWVMEQHGGAGGGGGRLLRQFGILPPDEDRPRPVRRAGKSDRFYARLAAAYAELVSSGGRHPIKTLAQRRRVESATIRNWIREARVRGLLTRGVRGRATGDLTPGARRILEEGRSTRRGVPTKTR